MERVEAEHIKRVSVMVECEEDESRVAKKGYKIDKMTKTLIFSL